QIPPLMIMSFCSFFNDTQPPQIYTLSLHDALPIYAGTGEERAVCQLHLKRVIVRAIGAAAGDQPVEAERDAVVVRIDQVNQATRDRKSTRLNSSHSQISYAVFCLKKKKKSKK